MSACTFFGHRDSPTDIKDILFKTIELLITRNGVEIFFVGNNGSFDRIVLNTLKELKGKYPHIKYFVVLAYLSKHSAYEDSIFPDGIEFIPKRFAINFRNNYMLSKSDYVITYTVCNVGGAVKFENMARKQNKTVINIASCSLV